MKTSITLNQELDIMYTTRGKGISKPYAVNGSHFSSLKSAIVAAKNVNRDIIHIMTTRENVRFKTVATITKHDFDFVEIVIW